MNRNCVAAYWAKIVSPTFDSCGVNNTKCVRKTMRF